VRVCAFVCVYIYLCVCECVCDDYVRERDSVMTAHLHINTGAGS
jgi:hypothetical protein